jgi:hypothetical protein
VVRQGYEQMFAKTGADFAYVVGTHHEELVHKDGGGCFVERGLLKMKLQEGLRHPFVRAVGLQTRTLFDCTVGLAHDAVHLALALPELRIQGTETSLLLFTLLEEGLPRLGVADRVTVAHTDALHALRALPDGAMDVVFLDPMMSRPKGSTPTFDALRLVASAERASPALLHEAARVASQRVVLKLGKGAPLPPGCPLSFPERLHGKAVTYHVSPRG